MPAVRSTPGLSPVQAAALFEPFARPENDPFELRHKAIIDRFGRYPQRNRIVGRASSEAEVDFLKRPGSSF